MGSLCAIVLVAHSPPHVSDAQASSSPLLGHRRGNSERCADLPGITEQKVAEPRAEPGSLPHPFSGSQHVTFQNFSDDPFSWLESSSAPSPVQTVEKVRHFGILRGRYSL